MGQAKKTKRKGIIPSKGVVDDRNTRDSQMIGY
jgi:hypothetical protein